jgi:hypothetical protein
MQPRTPTRKVTGRVNNRNGTVTVAARLGHYPKQIDGQLSFPAPDTRTHRTFDAAVRPRGGPRILALDHGSVYRHRTDAPNHAWH